MNSAFSSYLLFQKDSIDLGNIGSNLGTYDRFISAYNESDRVRNVFREVSAGKKHWLLFPEYGAWDTPPNAGDESFACADTTEDEVISDYLAVHPIDGSENVCIDITGFIRPHIMYLLRHLFHVGKRGVDLIYSEPVAYRNGASTAFSGDVSAIRLVRGFEGSHSTDTDGEYLVIGCSYDSKLMAAVAGSRLRARKVQLFPFPALRPHMYQENRIRTQECETSFNPVADTLFAPAHDPFATAHVLSDFRRRWKNEIKNLYLSPLATKPQVVGFTLFYLLECIGQPVSVTFPFSEGYNRDTSSGVSELWRYRLDFDLVRAEQSVYATRNLK